MKESGANEEPGPSAQVPATAATKGKGRAAKRKKVVEADVTTFKPWEGEVTPLDIIPLAYLAPGGSHVVVLCPRSTLGGS